MRVKLAANTGALMYNGTSIRGIPQEVSAGSVSCDVFAPGETFFWQWDQVNPSDPFTLSFTNTHTASVTLNGFLVGYAV